MSNRGSLSADRCGYWFFHSGQWSSGACIWCYHNIGSWHGFSCTGNHICYIIALHTMVSLSFLVYLADIWWKHSSNLYGTYWWNIYALSYTDDLTFRFFFFYALEPWISSLFAHTFGNHRPLLFLSSSPDHAFEMYLNPQLQESFVSLSTQLDHTTVHIDVCMLLVQEFCVQLQESISSSQMIINSN